MTVGVSLNFRELDRRSDRALAGVAVRAGREATRLIGAPVWGWDRLTPRHNGEIAGTPRDIVDTGALLTSQQEPAQVQPNLYQITWEAEHSAAVFLGAVFKARSGSLPARNAPLMALRGLNLAEVFAKEWG